MTRAAPTKENATITIWLSPTVEADYRNRGCFPGLRSDKAASRESTWAIFYVSPDFAREVLDDAQERKRELKSGRGLSQGYRSLAAKIVRELEQFDGVRPDPGKEAWEADVRSSGCHDVGARLFDANGEPLVVARAYGVHKVRSSDGEFRNENGNRIDYRHGYVCVRPGNDDPVFYAAWELFDRDGECTHLRLVHAA